MENIKEGPDRGWSWVIAFAACFNSLILAGIFRTSGVLFVAFISEFGVTREEASWPVVLCISVLNLTGIITGPLGLRFGVRPVVIVGSLVATLGISSCYFTTSLNTITFLFGVVFGVGYGLSSTLMPVIVNEYFLNHRATANGIANSGSCFGSVILPPLFEYLIDLYGLSGCFLLTGGIVLHIAISGALMRPPVWLKETKCVTNVATTSNCSTTNTCVPGNLNSYNDASGYDAVILSIERRNSQLKQSKENENATCTSIHGNFEDKTGCSVSHNETNKHSELANNLRKRAINDQNVGADLKESIRNSSLDKSYGTIEETEENNCNELYRSIKDLEESLKNFKDVCEIYTELSGEYKSCDSSNTSDTDSSAYKSAIGTSFNGQSPHSQIDSKIDNSTKLNKETNLQIEEKSQYYINNLKKQTAKANTSQNFGEVLKNENSIPNTVFGDDTYNRTNGIDRKNEDVSSANQISSLKLPLSIRTSFLSVLACPMFYVTAVTNVSFYFLYHMYVVIIVDFSLDKGVPDTDTKYVLFAFAVSDLVGRLFLGWITDRHLLRRPTYVMCCMALIGINFFSFPFVNGYAWLIFVSCLYGLLLGCTMVVFPILLVDFLGIEIQAVAMGCMCFMNGLVSLTRPFLIGYFRDNVGSYSNIFFILGIISLVASFLWFLEYCFVKTKKTNTETSTV